MQASEKKLRLKLTGDLVDNSRRGLVIVWSFVKGRGIQQASDEVVAASKIKDHPCYVGEGRAGMKKLDGLAEGSNETNLFGIEHLPHGARNICQSPQGWSVTHESCCVHQEDLSTSPGGSDHGTNCSRSGSRM